MNPAGEPAYLCLRTTFAQLLAPGESPLPESPVFVVVPDGLTSGSSELLCQGSKKAFFAPANKAKAIYPINIKMKIGTVVWRLLCTRFFLLLDVAMVSLLKTSLTISYRPQIINI
jgi:hypothetical protein